MTKAFIISRALGPVSLWLGMASLLAGCATLPRGAYDPEIKVAAEAAQAALQRGEVARADALYGRALARAKFIDNRDEVVRNAYNLALCRMSSGQLGDARNLLVQARLLTPGGGVILARILLAEAEAARLAGDSRGSEQLARQAVAAGVDREGQVQALLLQGEAGILTGQLQSALDFYQGASRHVSRDTPAPVRARLDAVAAALVQSRVMSGSVAKLQLSRAEWFKKAAQFNDMIKSLQAAAIAFELDSKWAEAFDCRIRAAQGLQASGDVKAARIEVRSADELAGRTGNESYSLLAASLLNELK